MIIKLTTTVFLVGILFSYGCTTKITGQVQDGVYHSASGGFFLPVPVDLSSGGDGSVVDDAMGVTFTHKHNQKIQIWSLKFTDPVIDKDEHRAMHDFILSYYKSMKKRSEKFYSDVHGGTTVFVFSYQGDTPERPQKIGLAGFRKSNVAIIVSINISDMTIFFNKDRWGDKEQIELLNKSVLDIVKTIKLKDVSVK